MYEVLSLPSGGLKPLAQLRANYHRAACYAAETQDLAELITTLSKEMGWSPAFVENLVNHDPAFRDLVAHKRTKHCPCP